MIKNNLKVLGAYILGIIVSLFISLALGALFDFSHVAFSFLTSLITLCLMYFEIWKFGRNDKLKDIVSVKRAILNILFFVIIAAVLEISVALCKYFNATDFLFWFSGAGLIWFYPFTGFYTDSTFLTTTLFITAVIIAMCLVAYYMGVREISLLDKIAVWKKKRSDKVRKKHEDEIEKIKEQYRNNK